MMRRCVIRRFGALLDYIRFTTLGSSLTLGSEFCKFLYKHVEGFREACRVPPLSKLTPCLTRFLFSCCSPLPVSSLLMNQGGELQAVLLQVFPLESLLLNGDKTEVPKCHSSVKELKNTFFSNFAHLLIILG